MFDEHPLGREGEIAAAAFDAEVEFKFNRLYPAVVNHRNETALATGVMPLLLGGAGINVYRPIYRDRAAVAT